MRRPVAGLGNGQDVGEHTAPGRLLADVLAASAARLARAGIDTPGLDARLLVGHALGLDAAALLREARAAVASGSVAKVDSLLARRCAGEPVSRILGWREFYGRRFSLGPSVLDPRPDTETLVAAALAAVADTQSRPLRILDLGTGSGAILVTLLAQVEDALGVGVDLDPAAIAVARANAAAHGVGERARFVVADWASSLAGAFDIVVANPPYIPTATIAGLAPEVREHDPFCALDGGTDGLGAYRQIAPQAARCLAPRGGTLLVEIGSGQAADVAAILGAAGLDARSGPRVVADLAGRDRVVVAHRAPAREATLTARPGHA